MRLIALEAYGFKSFADKIRLSFDKGITAIVGPNGSGKSNITDAVRWVLGEGKKGLLRLSKSEDIIFSGTPKRRALGVAEVSLTFLNEGDLAVDFREVVITRRLFRSGESEFYINRSSCRLKDILSLFADTGIGADSMSIIGQNRIDDILSGKPEDTRAYFEEAAGISKYRIRKQESLRKLDDMEKNLERVKDIMGEIENSLAPLADAAEKKKKFDTLEKELFKYRLTELYIKYEKAQNAQKTLENEKNELKVKLTAMDAAIAERENNRLLLEKQSIDADSKLEEFTKRLDAANVELTAIEKEIAKLTERVNNKEAARGRILGERETLTDTKNKLEAELKEAESEGEAQRNKLDAIKTELSAKEEEYQAKVAEYKKLTEKETELGKKNEEIGNIRADLNKTLQNISITNERITLLERLKEDYEGFNAAAKAVLKSRESWRSGVLGAVIELIEVPDKYKTAVEVALGAAAQNIAVEDENVAKAAIEYLKRGNYGRATFLPLSTITVKPQNNDGLAKYDFVIGTLDKLVTADSRYEKLVKFLLGRNILCDTFDNAMKLARGENFTKRIVTLDGSLILPGGSITGGSVKIKSMGFLDRKKELEEHKGKVKSLFAKKQEILRLLEEKENEKENFEAEFSETRENLSKILNAIKEDIQRKETESLLLTQSMQHGGADIRRVKDELSRVNENLEKNLREEESLNSLETPEILSEQKKLLNEKNFAKLEIERQKDLCMGERMEFTARIKEEEKNIRTMTGEKEHLKEEIHKKELTQERNALVMEESEKEIKDTFNLSAEEAKNEITEVDGEDLKEKLKSVAGEIEALGDINHAAVKEYEELKSRHDLLEGQSNDIVQAREDLNIIIKDIEREMTERFNKAFAEIEKYFDDIFKKLFGGGQATLRLTEPSDVLNTGVLIIVELPNKKRQNLFALSGGERALTVVALLFAFLAYKPSPFSVLDEIDAPLDEANLARFGAFLREYGEETQFIVVTHRKTTMESANVMYGVTATDGVSQVLSVKI